jgi:TPR repeat protein
MQVWHLSSEWQMCFNDLRSAAHYFQLSADQRNANARYHSEIYLLQGLRLQRDLSGAIRNFMISAELGSPDGQFVIGLMAENGIRLPADFAVAVRNHKLTSARSSTDSICCGWQGSSR